ncbi:hypothetical protein HPB49_013881 [Dermacentor silvarum]|uniref:Uncharacterized protein n=1 Tax=Dermacentor silvarum TaxID=543639 RepID=A0ACB8DDA7_DERSI|nr:hypothetical protein HPB49_013881 [Dermacentor silvarum]
MDEEFLSTGADVPFAEFVSIDNDVLTCELQSVVEIVAEVVGDDAAEVVADEAPEDGGENEGLRPPATFAEALAGLEALQSFFRMKDNENADNGLQCVQKDLFLSKANHKDARVLEEGAEEEKEGGVRGEGRPVCESTKRDCQDVGPILRLEEHWVEK